MFLVFTYSFGVGLGRKGSEKICQVVKREGLGNANQIPIEQAMSWGVTQARVEEENWNVRRFCLHFAPNPQVGLTYCAAALSFFRHVALKSKDDIESNSNLKT